ncbi:MAG: DinB family protein [Thermoanaerobaculia bacterium]
MDLLPEQERALGYIRRRGTEAPLAEIRSRVADAYREIEMLVAPVEAALARRRPVPSSWSVHEIVDHLVESERPAAWQLAQLLAGRLVDDPIPAGLQSPQPFEVEWQTLLERFRGAHERILELLGSASDDLSLTPTAPVELVVKCASPDGTLRPVHWFERLDWKAYAVVIPMHNREHVGQIQRALESIG